MKEEENIREEKVFLLLLTWDCFGRVVAMRRLRRDHTSGGMRSKIEMTGSERAFLVLFSASPTASATCNPQTVISLQ